MKKSTIALFAACDANQKQTAHFIASLGTAYLKEKKSTAYLLKTGFLPDRFNLSMVEGRFSLERESLLDAYLRFGKLNDQDLIDAWPDNISERFSLLRSILIDRSSIKKKFQQFLMSEFSLLSAEQQELAKSRWRSRPDSFSY